jgi:type II secretory pathway predicted ATPase ExeA
MRDPVFGFTGVPFASAPDPQCWAPLAGQQQAFESLVHCVESGRGIAILTGPAGIGKSLLCHRIADRLQQDFRVACLPDGRFEGIPSLLQAVLFELGWPYQGLGTQELRLQLRTALREIRRDCRGTVLILDEAHAACEDVLEEVRAATNLVQDGRPLLRVLLSGQYSLEEMLTSPQLDALNQRVGCHVSLEPLTRSESADFIAYRLRSAGADLRDVVTPQAVQTIGHAAAGNPRCLNRLCDRSFELAAAAGRKPLDDATVRLALDELKRLPLHWNDPPPPETPQRDDRRDDVLEEEPPVARPVSRAVEFAEAPSGEAAVFEFGADDTPPSGNGHRPADAPATVSTSQQRPAENPGPADAIKLQRTSGRDTVAPRESAKPTVTEPVASGRRREDEIWTPVETMPATVRNATVAAPEICFATHPGQSSVRIQSGSSTKQKPKTSVRQPMQEEAVDDHYAALVAAQRRQPVRVIPPAVVKPAPRPPEPRPVDLKPTSPDEAVAALLSAVEDAVDNGVTREADVPVPGPRRADAEPVRFHSIEDYLQSARQDAVRMDRQEPNPAPSARQAVDQRAAGPREVDLYTRLRRLQGADP